MRRVLVTLLVATGMVLLSPSVALACSCAQVSTADQVARADTVVVGTLDWVADNGIDRTMLVAVDQVFKGKAGLREKVHTTDEASCGLGDLATDKEYVFFLRGTHPGRMTASLCDGTTPYGEKVVNEVQRITHGPFEPLPTYVTDLPPSTGPDPIRIVGIGVIVLAVLAGVALAMRRGLGRWPRG